MSWPTFVLTFDDHIFFFCHFFSYQIMLSCWRANPEERPSFTDLRNELEKLLEEQGDEQYISVNCADFDDYCALVGNQSSSSENEELALLTSDQSTAI